MHISGDKRREWYTEKCAKLGWSVRQLELQINTMFYERLLVSEEKDAVATEIQKTEPKPEYEKIIRDSYVLEFLVLPENPHFYKRDQEQAIIDHLQKFILELGRGFLMRQQHFFSILIADIHNKKVLTNFADCSIIIQSQMGLWR